MVASILKFQGHSIVIQRMVVEGIKKPGTLDDCRRNLNKRDLISRKLFHCPQSNATTLPDHQNGFGIRVKQHGKITGKQLRSHIKSQRGIGLSVHTQENIPGYRKFGGHRCMHTLLKEKDFIFLQLSGFKVRNAVRHEGTTGNHRFVPRPNGFCRKYAKNQKHR